MHLACHKVTNTFAPLLAAACVCVLWIAEPAAAAQTTLAEALK